MLIPEPEAATSLWLMDEKCGLPGPLVNDHAPTATGCVLDGHELGCHTHRWQRDAIRGLLFTGGSYILLVPPQAPPGRAGFRV